MTDDSYIVYDPEEGWQEAGPREDADSMLGDIIDHYRDEAGDGWHEDAENIALYRLVPVTTVRLERTATADDDTEEGRRCREAGWDFFAGLVEVQHEDPLLAAGKERGALAARVDELEARLVDAVSAREQAESAVPAGVAVLDLAALRAHVERLLSYVQHVSPCARIVAPGMVNPGRPCTCGLTDARAATPAESLEEHDRGVAARALRWAMGACPVCGGSGSAPADVCPGCPDGDRDHVCPTEQRPCSQCGWLRERAAAIGGGEP